MQVRRRRKKKETGVGREKKKTRRVCERARTGRTFFADGATLSQSWRRPFRPSAAPIESGPHKTRKKKTKQKKTKATSKRAFPRIDFICFLVSLSAGHSGSTTRCCGEEKKNRVRYRTRYLSAIDSSSLRIVYVRLRLVSRKDVG